jgi:hypothetical protein
MAAEEANKLQVRCAAVLMHQTNCLVNFLACPLLKICGVPITDIYKATCLHECEKAAIKLQVDELGKSLTQSPLLWCSAGCSFLLLAGQWLVTMRL